MMMYKTCAIVSAVLVYIFIAITSYEKLISVSEI